MSVPRWGVVLLALAACYRPAELGSDCTVSCGDLACPGGQVCGGDLVCHTTGTPECTTRPLIDAAIVDGIADGLQPDSACFGGPLVTPCAAVTSAAEITGTVNTTTDNRCQHLASAPGLCVIAGTQLVVHDVRFIGNLPVVLVGGSAISLGGMIAAGSDTSFEGPGARLDACPDSQPSAGTSSTRGAGGGAGGSFAEVGGSGGISVGAPGEMGGFVTLTSVRAGCPGTNGGAGNGMGASGGLGGGGIAFVAPNVNIAAGVAIDASGAPGQGATELGGGGGGGAGGLIQIEADQITFAGVATMRALGGGGGGGAGISVPGNPGVASSGGGGGDAGLGAGGDGGTGNSGMARAGGVGNGDHCGGGGGGGSEGFIFFHGSVSGTASVLTIPAFTNN